LKTRSEQPSNSWCLIESCEQCLPSSALHNSSSAKMEMTLESVGHLWMNSGLTVIISDNSSLQAQLNDSKLKCLEISPSPGGQVALRRYTCIRPPHDNNGAFCQGIKPTQLWEIPCSLRIVSRWTAKYILETMDTSSN